MLKSPSLGVCDGNAYALLQVPMGRADAKSARDRPENNEKQWVRREMKSRGLTVDLSGPL